MSYITDNYAEYAQHLPTPVSDTWETFLSYIVSYDSDGTTVTFPDDVNIGGDLQVTGDIVGYGELVLPHVNGNIKLWTDDSTSPYQTGIYWWDDDAYKEFLSFYSQTEDFKLGNDSYSATIRATSLDFGSSGAGFNPTLRNNFSLKGYNTTETTSYKIGSINSSNEAAIGDASVPLRLLHNGTIYGLPADAPWYTVALPNATSLKAKNNSAVEQQIIYAWGANDYVTFGNTAWDRAYLTGSYVYLWAENASASGIAMRTNGGTAYITHSGYFSIEDLATHMLLHNEQQLLWRNNADSAYLNVAYVNTSDNLVLGTDVGYVLFATYTTVPYNDGYRIRNDTQTADLMLAQMDTSENISLGSASSPAIKSVPDFYAPEFICSYGGYNINVAKYSSTVSASMEFGASGYTNYFPSSVVINGYLQFLDATPQNAFSWDATNDQIEVYTDLDLRLNDLIQVSKIDVGEIDSVTSITSSAGTLDIDGNSNLRIYTNNYGLQGRSTTNVTHNLIKLASTNIINIGSSGIPCLFNSQIRFNASTIAYWSGTTAYTVLDFNVSDGTLVGHASYPTEIKGTEVMMTAPKVAQSDAYYVTSNGTSWYAAVAHSGTRIEIGTGSQPLDLLGSSLRVNGGTQGTTGTFNNPTQIVVDKGIVTSVSV